MSITCKYRDPEIKDHVANVAKGEESKFICDGCGKEYPAGIKFCAECGAKKPEGAPIYQCNKCGWKPEDPKNPPKFCPECGDRFDENDIK